MIKQELGCTVVLKPEWHKLTNWRCIEEVYRFYPNIYEEWANKGIIPLDKRILTETHQSDTFGF